MDQNLNLHHIVHNRIQDIHDTIGEDAKILDDGEEINEEEMYANYERDVKQLTLFEENMEKESISFNEAEEELRKMKESDPEKFEEIRSLRDGIRCSVSEDGDKQFVLCQADKYSQLLEQKHSKPINIDQRYVKDELQKIHNSTELEDLKSQTKMFENVFLKVQRPAVLAELKKLRKNKVTDRALIDRLTEIWYRHSLHEISMSKEGEDGVPPIPKIICGELL